MIESGQIKPKIALVVTSVLMVKFFLVPHIEALSKNYDMTLILKNDFPDILDEMKLPVKVIEIPIERKISFFLDFCALLSLVRIFYRERFQLVHTATPKAGLLGMLAAWLVRVPIRVHTFQGEVWSTKSGIYRLVLKFMDYMVGNFATSLTVVSETEKNFLVKEGVILSSKSSVLLNGSISGVNLAKFRHNDSKRKKIRSSLGIDEEQTVFIYVGRINPEKGVVELLMAFKELKKTSPNCRLVIVGVDEDNFLYNFLSENEELGGSLNIISYTPNPETFMMASDILVLPSHREGFGMVIIEAGALGLPAIGSDIYGIQDAIVDGETGLLFKKNNSLDLLKKMKYLVTNPGRRLQMGEFSRARVEKNFNQEDVVKEMVKFYSSLFNFEN